MITHKIKLDPSSLSSWMTRECMNLQAVQRTRHSLAKFKTNACQLYGKKRDNEGGTMKRQVADVGSGCMKAVYGLSESCRVVRRT